MTAKIDFNRELKIEGGRQIKAHLLGKINKWAKTETFSHKQVVGLISSVDVERVVE